MKGETALLCPAMIRIPTKTSMTMIGASHHAFRSFKKLHSSPKSPLIPFKKMK